MRSDTKKLLGLLAFGIALASVFEVRAQDVARPALQDAYFGLEFSLGFAGNVAFESDDVSSGGATLDLPEGEASDFGSELAIGGAIRFTKRVYRAFSLGARIGAQSWRSDNDVDTGRNLAFDLSLLPQAGLPVSRAVELYVAVPFGLTFDVLNETRTVLMVAGNSQLASRVDPGFGWNLAFMLGLRGAVSSGVGLFAEIGYALHRVSHNVNFSAVLVPFRGDVDLDLDVAWSQIALNAGVTF